MCDFESALMCYTQGINLKYPHKIPFEDGYYRTIALMYDLTGGEVPMFYGGNMRVFYRLVQGQERAQKIFNDTYKHYDELYPLEPYLTGVQDEINMFHVTKPEPPDYVQRRVKKTSIMQLKTAHKVLGIYWDNKMQIEKHLIKQEHFLPRQGRENNTGKIDRALKYLRSRIDKFEVICSLMKNKQIRRYDELTDWLLEYGKWMREKKITSVIPPAKEGGLKNSRYKWALSQTLCKLQEKPMDICWVRQPGRLSRSNHIIARRRPWREICGYRSAEHGAIAAIRTKKCDDLAFMKKLDRTVLSSLKDYAPPENTFRHPKHIKAIIAQAEEYENRMKKIAKASEVSLVDKKEEKEANDNLYYDPDSNEDQWDKNRALIKQAIVKRREHPAILPLPDSPGSRPVPACLLEVFETTAHEDTADWDKRRRKSAELQEDLRKAEATKVAPVHEAKHQGLFAPTKEKKQPEKKKPKTSDVEENGSQDRLSAGSVPPKESIPADPVEGAPGEPEVADATEAGAPGAPERERHESLVGAGVRSKENPDDDEEVPPPEPAHPPRKLRRMIVDRGFKYEVLRKKVDNEAPYLPRPRRRTPYMTEDDLKPREEAQVETEHVKTDEELEAERRLAAKADDPVEIARRRFDNQKAALLEKAYSILMTCTKVSEFLELELEIADITHMEFPPNTMRYPDGAPIILRGYPPPADTFTKLTPQDLANGRKKRKKRVGQAPQTAQEAATEDRAVERLMAEKVRRASLTQSKTGLLQTPSRT
ncbi:hypothetical protein RvY_07996 [Ramazzottius varieornatus]|uniref:Uncharacterized protein n=1 Tax=Ramazzottius varieornatus TaxID=947166 RepID=A0A1D1VA27_RAMVA|nr:hypothetical protein RvY_07996 [Ramazzottius varieornatus]